MLSSAILSRVPRPILIAALALPLSMRPGTVDSSISAATVYGDRAVVTRVAEVNVTPGEQALVFEQLPVNFMDQSLQVSGHGTASATILDVNVQTAFVEVTPNARAQDLEGQVRDLKKQIRTLDDRAGVLAEEREFVKRMLVAATDAAVVPAGTEPARTGAAVRPTLEEWQKLLAYADETLGKISAETRSLDDQRDGLKAKQAAAEQQLDELRGARGKSLKTVTVRVAVATAGKLNVELRYAVPGASWVPSYDARLRAADRSIELTYYGMVRNATGEDWNGITLTLSTARPGLGGGAPGLRPWVVDVARPMLAREEAANAPAAARAMDKLKEIGGVQQFATPAGGKGVDVFDAATLSASVEAGATSATFKIPVNVSVPANNTMQKVAIASAKLAATLRYQATPKMMETAFLSAYAFNNTDYPLLAGLMNTFLDDTFIAASRLKTVMPGEKFELQLGADEGIAIKRKLVSRFAETTGLTSKSRRITYEYLVTVTDNKATPERVVFKEPVPVSRDERIEVKLLVPDEKDVGSGENPKEVTRDEDGKLVWRLDMKPAEKRELTLKFSVEYPAELNVTGLE